ncbi:hypothetical protein EJC51_00870 [Streptomyces aquilus]|uniref:Uncharacterized protein n=1 Tax=Streptomyces aquilus TaxID=2548456 RepID=A0A3S9HRT6_9ACTN|nr:hypothetical protein EJC51_00870 [Streptomyces aquilus]
MPSTTRSTPSDPPSPRPASPSSSAQAAREALAVRLTHLRKDAGLTGGEVGVEADCAVVAHGQGPFPVA